MLEFLSRSVLPPVTELAILCAMAVVAIPLVHFGSRGVAWLLGTLLGVRLWLRSRQWDRRVRWWFFTVLLLALIGLVVWVPVQMWHHLVPTFRKVGLALAGWVQHPLAPLVWLVLVLAGVGLVVFGAWSWKEPAGMFKLRYFRPVREWIEAKGRAVVALGQLRVLGRPIRELEELLNRVQVRWCRACLGYLFFLSIFTIPIQVFPRLDDVFYAWVGQPAAWLMGRVPWLPAENVAPLGHVFVLVFDWVLLMILLYAVVFNLSLLFRKDLFASVEDAVRYAVNDLRAFTFAGYFRRDEEGNYQAGVLCGETAAHEHWLAFAPAARGN